jgi:tRNA(adenine34) deaminase
VSEVRIFLGAPLPLLTITPKLEMTDEDWMRDALVLADRAAALGEVPVGAVLLDEEGKLLANGHNLREAESDPSAHAEMIALRAGAKAKRSWRLERCTLFVTLEPCVMCAGALVNARIERVVWGCDDPKAGACVTLFTIGADTRLNHRFVMTRGVLETECAERLKSFFASLRAQRSRERGLPSDSTVPARADEERAQGKK